jgi:hypothetical protein
MPKNDKNTTNSIELAEFGANNNKNDDEYEENTTCSTGGIVVFAIGLISGTFSALVCKMAYDSTSIGIYNYLYKYITRYIY